MQAQKTIYDDVVQRVDFWGDKLSLKLPSILGGSRGPASRDLPPLIGITGKAGAGKSTLANALCHEMGFVTWPFADPIKQMLISLGVPEDVAYGNDVAKSKPLEVLSGRTFREAAQTLGTYWGREIMHPDFWVAPWCLGVDAPLKRGVKIVADDVRFDNEVRAILDRGGIIVHIERDGAGAKGAAARHASETQNLFRTLAIHNDKGPDQLLPKLISEWPKYGT